MKYSVIIPVYNGQDTISDCLESLIPQIDPQLGEIIVVDDGSNDKTESILGFYRHHVNYVKQINSGPAVARNQGAKISKAEILFFIDADCIPGENWVKMMLLPFENPEVIGIKGVYKTKQTELAARFAQQEFEDRYKLLMRHKEIDFIDSYSMGVRRDCFLQVGGFDESFVKADNEDVDLSYKLSRLNGIMVFQPEAYVFHVHRKSIWDYAKTKFGRGYFRMKVYRSHPDKIIKDSYTPQTLKLQVLCSGLIVFLLFPLGLFFPRKSWEVLRLVLGLLVISAWEFMFNILKTDKTLFVLSPFFIFIRAIALFTGSICGIADQFIYKK